MLYPRPMIALAFGVPRCATLFSPRISTISPATRTTRLSRVVIGRAQYFSSSLDNDGSQVVSSEFKNVMSETILRPYARHTQHLRAVVKNYKASMRELKKMDRKAHHKARAKILKGETTLSYRELQRLCRLNEIKATGKKEVLERRLFNLFRRLDPNNIRKMGQAAMRSVKDGLDNSPEEEEKRNKLLSENDTPWDDHAKRSSWRKLDFVADLSLLDKIEQNAKETKEYGLLSGKIYAAPAPTGRATCRKCGEKIEKGSVRISEHDYVRFYKGNPGSFSFRPSEKHYHASCFLENHGRRDETCCDGVSLSQSVTENELSESQMECLSESIKDYNRQWESDKEWQTFRLATTISYPGTLITFGSEDPDRLKSTKRTERVGNAITFKLADEGESLFGEAFVPVEVPVDNLVLETKITDLSKEPQQKVRNKKSRNTLAFDDL